MVARASSRHGARRGLRGSASSLRAVALVATAAAVVALDLAWLQPSAASASPDGARVFALLNPSRGGAGQLPQMQVSRIAPSVAAAAPPIFPRGAASTPVLAAAAVAAAATILSMSFLGRGTLPHGASNGAESRTTTSARRVVMSARGGFFGESDDPYAKCTALKLQIGLQFSKPLLETLNKLADSADTDSDGGLHQLMLDVMLALRRSEAAWRYGSVERLVFDSEDDGRQASSALQRWGIEGQSKWGDGEDYGKMDKRAPAGVTEYLVITALVSCYGTVCPEDKNDLKVRSISDVKKIIDSLCGVQVDELIQLDVQWIPEEAGDSLSAMEVTMKFPELVTL